MKSATTATHTTRPATTPMVEPQIIEIVTDVDTFIIYTDCTGWRMRVDDPHVICRATGKPILNPEPLAMGATVFKRTNPGTGEKTTCSFSNKNFTPRLIVEGNTIRVIPPKP
jgi:hypothetical protein